MSAHPEPSEGAAGTSLLGAPFRWLRDTFRFLGAHPSSFAVVGVALAAGALAGVPMHEKGYDYMWRDARFCDDCHVHDYANEAWATSIHGGVTTCHDCHRVPIRHYPRNLFVTVFDAPQSEADIHRPEVGTQICSQCHLREEGDEPLTGPLPEAVRQKLVKVDDSPLHKVHMSATSRLPSAYQRGKEDQTGGTALEASDKSHEGAAGAILCADCHGAGPNRAHSFEATRDNCVLCHQEPQAHAGGAASLDCRDCHLSGFLAPAETAAR